MVHYIPQGDIFAIDGVTSFAHGCNCVGAMGKGIAVQFRDRFPEMYLQYRELCRNGRFQPGDVFPYCYGAGYVYNLGTQTSWRTRATLGNIRLSLQRMMELACSHGVRAVALPAVGAGLGGLKWADVRAVIDEVAAGYLQTDLYVVESYGKG